MSEKTYLIIGTTTVDIVSSERILGGTVSYGAPIAHLFGHEMRIMTSASDNSLLSPLRQVSDFHLIHSDRMATFENIYSESRRKQIIYHTAKDMTVTDLPDEWVSSKLVHLAPLANDVDYEFTTQFSDATVLLTPQGYMRQWDNSGVIQFKRFLNKGVLSNVDILVLSRQDIAEAPSLEYEFPKYTEHVIISNGDEPGMYYHNGEKIPYEVYPAKEVDPTGAGDVFASSILASLPFVDNNMLAAIDVAARTAAHAVTVKGIQFTLSEKDIKHFIYQAREKYD